MRVKQMIRTCLYFDGCAEEAVNFYISVFPNSKVLSMRHRQETAHDGAAMFLTAVFELDGQQFVALNKSCRFQPCQSTSLFVSCERQDELDALWDQLTGDGGRPGRCGWLTDKFGISWQIIPAVLEDMLYYGKAEKSERAMDALWAMEKIDIMRVIAAYDGA